MDSPAAAAAYKKDFRKDKIPFKKDEDIKNEVTTIALKLAEDPSLSDAKVGLNKEIQDHLAQKKVRICWCCQSANCYCRQTLSNKHKLKKRYNDNCTGKQITFAELKDRVKTKVSSPTETNTAAANIKPATVTDYDSDAAELELAVSRMDKYQTERSEEFSFKDCVASMSTKILVSIETIPDYATLAKTAHIADKHCIICLKSKLTLQRLSDHYSDSHDLYWNDDGTDSLAEWLESEENWNG